MRKYNLSYYVYVENVNKKKIEKYNVLNDGFIEDVLKRIKLIDGDIKFTDKKRFAEQVESALMSRYWCKSEWEIILTDWPTHITTDEVSRLNNEVDDYKKEYGKDPYSLCVNLRTEEKIDVYDQVMMNWNIFIDYFWECLQ
jgi:hypothetical protein